MNIACRNRVNMETTYTGKIFLISLHFKYFVKDSLKYDDLDLNRHDKRHYFFNYLILP